jgi:hypothetical protein
LPANLNGKPQIIALSDRVAVSEACSLADGTSQCGQTKFKIIDSETLQEVTMFPYKGLTLDASKNQITVDPQSVLVGQHKVLVAAYLSDHKDVRHTVEI